MVINMMHFPHGQFSPVRSVVFLLLSYIVKGRGIGIYPQLLISIQVWPPERRGGGGGILFVPAARDSPFPLQTVLLAVA
jgi:hypothetical protein